jgi:adenylate cyclase
LVPLWLTVHVVSMTWARWRLGFEASYAMELDTLWPGGVVFQTAMMSLVWLHGCIGVHRWLSLRPWYGRVSAPALALAVLLPVLAWLGFIEAGRTYAAMRAADPGWRARLAAEENWPGAAAKQAYVFGPEQAILRGFELVLLAMLAGAAVRWAWARRTRVRITYDGGRTVSVAKGMTLLEASRSAGVPHASVCGGRGRCSTCRVRVVEGLHHLPPPTPGERRVLERIGAAPDMRLACQIRPMHALSVVRLLPAGAAARSVLRPMDPAMGREREIAVLFADLRGFTRLAESRLPYDTVYVLNRYFAAMGMAIEKAGGRVDKFLGDGIMALFGLDGDGEHAARTALAAAGRMSRALADLNVELAGDLREPLRMGIGIHLGTAIVGEMGWNRAVSLTAVGDTVNVASRLEGLTKEHGVQLVVSDMVLARASVSLDGAETREIDIRGRAGTLGVRLVADAGTLPVAAPSAAAEAKSSRAGALRRRLDAVTGRA